MNATAPGILSDDTVLAGRPWGKVIKQAVDFLCYDNNARADRYSATNTMKMQNNVYLGKGTVLYSESGAKLFTIIEDTCGSHDTLAGCCSEANNFLRYSVRNTPSCYANFLEILGTFGLGRNEIVTNVNFFMNVPVTNDGRLLITEGISRPGDYVDLRAERDVLAVISNCPQVRNPCNAYNPTPIRCIVRAPG
jgi:urea carboxylase-associated protein 1